MNIYICKVCGKECKEFKGLFIHLRKLHKFDDLKCKEYYDVNIKDSTKCKLNGCNNKIGFEFVGYQGFCCAGHLNTQKKIDKGTANYECKICNSYFEKIDSLSRHIQEFHKDITIENYYKMYMMNAGDPDGECLQCGNELKFVSIAKGYQKFCHNSSCNVLWHNKNSGRLVQSSGGIKLARSSGDNIPTQLGYWLKKGFSENDAKLRLSDRQNTNSLKKFIERHGEEVGIRKWNERQLKWQETLNAKSDAEKARINKAKAYGGINALANMHSPFISKNERELCELLKGEAQFCIEYDKTKHYFYDIKVGNKIIEYNGDYWHANPNKFSYKNIFTRNNQKMTAQQIWDNDKTKIEVAESQGYKVLTIWESDWKINKQKCIDECVRFLNGD